MPTPAGGPLSSSERTGRHARFCRAYTPSARICAAYPEDIARGFRLSDCQRAAMSLVGGAVRLRSKYEMNSPIVIILDCLNATAIH